MTGYSQFLCEQETEHKQILNFLFDTCKIGFRQICSGENLLLLKNYGSRKIKLLAGLKQTAFIFY